MKFIRFINVCIIVLLVYFFISFFVFSTVINCEGLELVECGLRWTFGNSFHIFWTKAERAVWTLVFIPAWLKEVIVGLILSDGYIQHCKYILNVRLRFAQSISNKEYFLFVFWLLSPICKSLPRLISQLCKLRTSYALYVETRSLPFLTEQLPEG